MEQFKESALGAYSKIVASFRVSDDNTILVAKFNGSYGEGSAGNGDGLFIFSALVSHYFVFEPVCVILDLTELNYTWGNTITKTLNFFQEIGRDREEKAKRMFIVVSDRNKDGVARLEKVLQGTGRTYCKDDMEALTLAKNDVAAYLA